ncbi:Nuclease PA3, putative [Perkinsus marinus ATCC 50983]|uniref:Nuclease PA3, putative n=1 Tax=Perkinsus marinus (strain ATCC 50983 / TXsc) TaxID=423536 RepID=C5K479_PERM5|nr:Nuclease PA3, putative [Perkinsus marinus ATCC 50983]EER20695.1 Nuclease PA3, putative [Perkinsus marinus ATCC 50983]|eukprot:XP_002788899.1 Nuclease PA3, putative [Perkinsus marinus ATCC 50983]
MSLRLVSIFATAIPAALAWGHDGHAVVAQLGQERIKKETQEALDAIMGKGVPMSNYSSWADEVKYGPDGNEWKWSSSLHYADTPDCHFDYARDCKNDYCVAGALKNYSRRVVDESLPLEQRQEALKFIVHFVGDAHQPLHIGKPEDLGGNKIAVHLGFGEKPSTNLHSTWDSKLIYELEDQSDPIDGEPSWMITEDAVSDELDKGGKYADEIDDWIEDCEKYGLDVCVDSWLSESSKTACDYSYRHVNGSLIVDHDFLPMDYYNNRIEVVKEQLAKGGVRLTWLLNTVFAAQDATPKPVPVDCTIADEKCNLTYSGSYCKYWQDIPVCFGSNVPCSC